MHPILAAKCFACHSGDKRSGGLALDNYADVLKGGRNGAAVIPGESKSSLLVERAAGQIAPQMPLAGPKLTPAELAAIRAWIDEGARSDPTAAPAKRPWIAPMALHAPQQSLDQILAACLSKHAPAQVSDPLFARRVFLDVWGVTPPPEELRQFLADRSVTRRAELIATLLADDKKYAEPLDQLLERSAAQRRGRDSTTARARVSPRGCSTRSRTNLPYDQFVAQLLNPTAPGDPDGFLIGVNWRGDVSASQTPAMQAAQNSAQVFLGINLKCNSCHDSFISQWKLKDAYGLASYFSAEEKLELYRCDVAQPGQFATPASSIPNSTRPPRFR